MAERPAQLSRADCIVLVHALYTHCLKFVLSVKGFTTGVTNEKCYLA
jgi:hypothetical protein